jgi:hypothetical protein
MVEFRVSRPLIVASRLVIATIGGVAALGAYLGLSQPGVIPLLAVAALAAFGVALIGLALFGPSKWCAKVLWFCQ